MPDLSIFSTTHAAYQFSSIKKHKWPEQSVGKILAEQCTGESYDSVEEYVYENFSDSVEAILDKLQSATNIFFFIDFMMTQIPEKVIGVLREKIKTNKIFFCCHFEPFTVLSFEYLTNHILSKDIDFDKCWFISANARVFDTVNKPVNLNVGFFDFFSGYHVYGCRDIKASLPNTDVISKKDFLCLNLKPRPARKFFIDLLKDYNVYENGYISYGGKTIEGTVLDQNTLVSYGNAHVILPSFFDISNWTKNVYFEIVMDEVHFSNKFSEDEEFIVFSEKIYRTIHHKLPFMVYSKVDYLKYLRALGFQTFDKLFDESYDDIADWQLRGKMIANQVKRFCQKTDIEKNQWVDQAKEIAEFNYNHLLKDENLCRLFLNRVV
jgi:hypothetical protein